jgi:hypothetical protein
MFYFAAGMLIAQMYSLIYRFAVFHVDPNMFEKFKLLKVQMLLLGTGQVIAIGFGVGFYRLIFTEIASLTILIT